MKRRHGDENDHDVVLTGKVRPWKRRASMKKDDRIRETQLQYHCNTCGFTGWSAHAELAKDGRTAAGKRVRARA